jgi:MSHA biogenesis protein MshI
MRWPWKRQGSNEQLVVSWSGQTLAYVLARAGADGSHQVLKFGVARQGTDSIEDFVHRLQNLGLKGFEARVMLRPEQYQWLQIDAPAVPPEELRSAARYQIREMLNTHVDDVTLDVMRVGDGQLKGTVHLFVVAATNAVLRGVLDLGDAMNWTVSVIDVQETAQRNLQSALAGRDGGADRANAALVLVQGQQAVLTISANEELFYTRRFELPEGFLTASWGAGSDASAASANSFMPVDEYVPDYSVGGVSYGNDYTGTAAAQPASVAAGSMDDDRAQRLLLEVQRSLDVWDRSWSSMPLNGMRVYAGERSEELSKWLGAQLGQTVAPLDVNALFPGFEGGAASDQALCLPLLGVLMRTESRKL